MESLNKKDLTEIKSYGRPPTLVETVMQAVMILRGNEPTWTEAKKQLGKRCQGAHPEAQQVLASCLCARCLAFLGKTPHC